MKPTYSSVFPPAQGLVLAAGKIIGGSPFVGASDRGEMADHQPLHRQEKMFERHGIEISRKTMGGWMAQCAELLDPL